HEALDAIVTDLDDDAWSTPTPAEGWDVADQIGHLTFFDRRATMAVIDRDAFAADLAVAARDIDAYLAGHLAATRSSSPDQLTSLWRSTRDELITTLAPLDPRERIPWYGPDMSARSFATARLMETWAHGQDIVDALGVHRAPTNRLRHIALLGVRTMGWSFTVNGLEPPQESVRVDLAGPLRDRWTWNDEVSLNVVRGDAEEFCLVVTQRRHLSDTNLEITGPLAKQWMQIAQAFAGPPGPGRSPGMFV
ncbi:MAG: TIGR03084 family metal-binding protein, partial [Actinomycetia bacterium]|nr:TIGR03084 family metal-binding protein [Actinomycetes bacterium]